MNAREQFWKGEFGDDYNRRSPGDGEANRQFFRRILIDGFRARREGAGHINAAVELGCGTGSNLRALRHLLPTADLTGVEINEEAAAEASGSAAVHLASILDWQPPRVWDLAFTKGLLIHIHPDDLPRAYAALVGASQRYVLVAEYYSPKPVEIPYRGHAGRLWKRDFAGELIDQHGLKLIDYGFVYRRDEHPQDDLNWFLMEKPFEPA